MKVCLINNLYKPHAVGGAEKVVEKQAQEFKKQGHEVVIITWGPRQNPFFWLPKKTQEDGVDIYRFYVPNIFPYKNLAKHNFILKLWWHKIDIWNYKSAMVAMRILKKEKPDEVWTHNLMGIGFSIPKVIQKLGIRHIHYLHDIQLIEPSGVLPWDHKEDSKLQKIYSWIMKRRMGKPDMVVSPTEFLQKFYQDRGFFSESQWQINRISNFEFRIPRRRSREISNSLGKKNVFVFVGSLVKHKGIRVLMQAWDKLDKTLDVELHIVGDGVLRKEVEKRAQGDGRVKVYGRLEKEELGKVYQKCGTLIFPSICIENAPTVLLEAMEHGLKIIASRTGGVEELVRDYSSASVQLVEPGNVEGLVKKIKPLPAYMS